MKKVYPFLLIVVAICMLAGCAETDEEAVVQKIVKVEVYRAADHTLLKTIDDAQTLAEFEKNIVFDEKLEWPSDPIEAEEEFQFVAYSESHAFVDGGAPEELFTVITYDGLNAITVQVVTDSLDDMALLGDVLSFTQEIPEETARYLKELAEEP